uniref:NADP-dependent oxidoreductase domain-containing protein n=1 Tax=Pseudo-nitzschia australis TaxID=44445 RepID=A0A7S4ARL3_9STRA
MIGSILKVVFARLLPLLVVGVAIFVGWCNLDESVPWEGRLFVVLIPLLKGYLPPILFGHGRLGAAKETPPVPEDWVPRPRPEGELFATLAGTGDRMPRNGLGMCCRPTAYDDVSVERSIEWFLLMGGRHIDGAHLYLNHAAIGRGVANAMARGVPREEIFLTTKIWPADFGYHRTLEKVPTYLRELNLDYVDMLLMHFPAAMAGGMPRYCKADGRTMKECRQDTWKALSELRARGLIRNVGVSNFATHHLEELLELPQEGSANDTDSSTNTTSTTNTTNFAGVAPISNNQISWSPWVPKEWLETVEFCRANHIAITGYSSLGGSLEHHKALTIDTLTDLAAKHDRSVAQIMLRWALQTGATIIPGTGNPAYMAENLSVYGFVLSDRDMDSIEALRESDDAKKFFTMKPIPNE